MPSDLSHLKHAQDLIDYIELVTKHSLDEQDKIYLTGTLNITYVEGYKRGCEVAGKGVANE